MPWNFRGIFFTGYEIYHICHSRHLTYLCAMRILAGILLLGILLQTCSKELIYTNYLVNKKFIASVLCVNKNDPGKHCNGKCHLKNQLNKDSEKQEGSDQKSKIGMEVFYLASDVLTISLQPVTTLIRLSHHSIFVPECYRGSVFHPPSVFSHC